MFVVLEGIDGCGKTTQSNRLGRWLEGEFGDERIVRTREPGGWEGGAAVRDFVLNFEFANEWSEFFLFLMDRCEHVARVVAPSLLAGKIVLSDRYMPSTLAYQILSNPSLSPSTKDYLLQLSSRIGLPDPDVVFWLDLPPAAGAERLCSRGKQDSFDMRGERFFERVRAGYAQLMRAAGGKSVWVRVDASRPEAEVFEEIKGSLARMLERNES